MKNLESLITKLDLASFVSKFEGYLARPKSLTLNGDIGVLKNYIDEIDKIHFMPPNAVRELDREILHLSKKGILSVREIFEFVKIIGYFDYLKALKIDDCKYLLAWFEKIIIPESLLKITQSFESISFGKSEDKAVEQGVFNIKFKRGIYPKLDEINDIITRKKREINKQCERIFSNPKLTPYLINKQIHLVDGKECILVSSGFGAAISGRILQRTQAGYFYLSPNALERIYAELDGLYNALELLTYDIEKEISHTLSANLAFLKFINAEFDKFDSLQARVCFARDCGLNFIAPMQKNTTKINTSAIILSEFCHPALKNPTPCDIEWNKKVLLITGVNAGGKTMLLKSLLSAALLAKFLLPFKINANKSQIAHFKRIYAIINDPQNAKNDISTFAGRMLEFRDILNDNDFLLGVDEIELGTDSSEASALYFEILKHLQNKNTKVVVTTHHKQLAAMMAENGEVDLLAAIYNEKLQIPTYTFLKDGIGKSYAYDTAARYGIPRNIVENAKRVYGENLTNLNELLDKTSRLHLDLLKKEERLNALIAANENKKNELDSALLEQNHTLREKSLELESAYHKAINELKEVLKSKDSKQAHRILNKHNAELKAATQPLPNDSVKLKVGDRAKMGGKSGVIMAINKGVASLELDDGIKMKVRLTLLKPAPKPPKAAKPTTKTTLSGGLNCGVSLDLHGRRAEEALEMLDKYISDCLIAGYDEVLIYHGIGSGILSAIVRDYLKAHPKVKSFADAPANSGGFGAKVVRF